MSRPTRAVALAATLGLGAAATAASAAVLVAPHSSAVEPEPGPVVYGQATDAAAYWLRDELENGMMVGAFGPDAGLTIDAGLGFAGLQWSDDVEIIADAIEANVDADNPDYNYVSGEAFGDAGSTYAGAVAKTVTLGAAAGRDLTTFGGENFVTRLESVVSDESGDTGRIADVSSYGDNSNTLGQSFAARGLAAAGSSRAGDALDYLLLQQCSAGFFRLELGETTADSCDADEDAEANTDVTALAVINLADRADDPDVARAVDAAIAWLASAQHADGSFGSDAQIAEPNANSTGLAGWAFRETQQYGKAARAATWLRARQVFNAYPCAPYIRADHGAVAYDDAALSSVSTAAPIDADRRDQFRRATAQAAVALLSTPREAGIQVRATAKDVADGSTQLVRVSGLAPSSPVCLHNGKVQITASPVGTATFSFQTPLGRSAVTNILVGDSYQHLASATIRSLGPRALGLRLRAEVTRGAFQRVIVSRLAAGERVSVRMSGVVVKTGMASADGVFDASFRVLRSYGPATVTVVGQFADRSATKKFTVVR